MKALDGIARLTASIESLAAAVRELTAVLSASDEPPSNDGGWLTKNEAARHLGVTTRTIDNYCRKGVLRRHKDRAGHIRFSSEELAQIGVWKS